MAHPRREIWTLQDGGEAIDGIAALAGRDAAGPAVTWCEEIVVLDTFDWRLHEAHLVLTREREALVLRSEPDGRVRAALDVAAPGDVLRDGDLPPGDLRDALSPVVGVRALLTRASLLLAGEEVPLAGDGAGRLGRVRIDVDSRGTRRPGDEVLVMETGSDARPRRRLRARIGRLPSGGGTGPRRAPLLEAAGITPSVPVNRPVLELEPGITIEQGIRILLRQLAATMDRNEKGIAADLDPEFLHDFRVALRRTRVILKDFRRVPPPGISTRARREFAVLGRMTTRLRDLDVLLRDGERWRSLVPAAFQGGVEAILGDVAAERAREQVLVARALGSPEYAGFRRWWRDVLRSGAPWDGPDAGRALANAARRRIRRQAGRVLELGRAIDDGSTAADLHRLRIEGKRLRYLLECFEGLAPPRSLRPLIVRLKRLQDNLGDGNDLLVQRDELLRRLEAMPPRGRARLRTAAAIGALVTALAARHDEVRAGFADVYDRFASRANRRRIEDLFGREPD